MSVERQTDELTVHFCSACRHRCATHTHVGAPSADYHCQYDQGAYVSNLERTRRRQARRIIVALASLEIEPDHLIDVGAGRGWFLSEIGKKGGPALAGADTSALSIQTLKSMGVQTASVRIDNEELAIDTSTLSFQPTILSLLDVIEHFPPSAIVKYMRTLLDCLPRTRWLVIKVPIGNGVLFQIARLLGALGWNQPYHQLFQVGTFPPHFHYFSKRSLEIFLSKLDIRPRRVIDDPDIDDVLGRIHLGGRFSDGASRFLTGIFTLLGKIASYDSRIVIGEYEGTTSPPFLRGRDP